MWEKAFPSTLHAAIVELFRPARYPKNYVAAIKKVYQHTDAYCDLKGQHIHYKPTRGVKEGCACSPLLFSIVYELPLKRLIGKYPNVVVCVKDIAIIPESQDEFEGLFAHFSVWRSRIGIRFKPEKTEVFHFHRPNSPSLASRTTCGGGKTACRYVTLSSPT